MPSRPIRSFLLAGAVAALLQAAPALAADAVTDAIQSAYAPYRAALFRTNSKAQAESAQAMGAAQKAWREVVDRFGRERGAPYDRDPAFATTLAKVGEVYARADRQVASGQLPEAHETLEEVRDLLAELRRRNGVIVYSDHMNAYHAEMEHVLQRGPKLLDEPRGLLELLAQAGVLDYLAARLRTEAPAALAADPEFATSIQAVESSVKALRQALMAQDAAAARDALGKIKGPYSRLFLRFG